MFFYYREQGLAFAFINYLHRVFNSPNEVVDDADKFYPLHQVLDQAYHLVDDAFFARHSTYNAHTFLAHALENRRWTNLPSYATSTQVR